MYLISAEGYVNAEVNFLRVNKTDKIWVSMKNGQDGVGAKTCRIYFWKKYIENMKKNLAKNETKKYKLTEREMFEKYNNLSENELNKKSNKEVYVRSYVMTSVIVNCRGKKKRRKKNR